MSRVVIISIQPKWCELIASGKKTVEVRKTKPKLQTPFKCYIYCTNGKEKLWVLKETERAFTPAKIASICAAKDVGGTYQANGKVIGEFVCDRADYVRNYGDAVDSYDCKASCLTAAEIIDYAKDKNGNFIYTYGWHISNLIIYDKPKELSEFVKFEKCPYTGMVDCSKWSEHHCLKRPPQSWCYVEEMRADG